MAMYDNPVNRFVARFLGSANLLDGETAAVPGGRVLRTGGALQIPLPDAVPEVARVTLMFRPQHLLLIGSDSEPASGTIRFTGRIQQREFLGNLIRYSVTLHDQTILFDQIHQLGTPSLTVGEQIELALPPDQSRFLTD